MEGVDEFGPKKSKNFSGFVTFHRILFCLIGLGWWGFKEDNSIFLMGMMLIIVSILLQVHYQTQK